MAVSKYLLDTHCLLWFQDNNPKIPAKVMDIIQNPENTVYFSQVNLFEITIKQTIGKLPDFTTDIEQVCKQATKDNFTFLPIKNEHLYYYKKVPLFETHRDPFDRLLIAIAIIENATILTVDKNFTLYKDLVKIFW